MATAAVTNSDWSSKESLLALPARPRRQAASRFLAWRRGQTLCVVKIHDTVPVGASADAPSSYPSAPRVTAPETK